MQKNLLYRREITGETNIFTCDYYITSEPVIFPDETEAFEVYGVKVCSSTGEYSEVLNVSSDKSFVEKLIKIIADATVTPCSLKDVIEDLIS